MGQVSNYPYCNTTTDLALAFKDIEQFSGRDTIDTFTVVGGQTNTYEKHNTGYFGQVYEDGAALTAKTSIARVEATAGTFWYDSDNDILYVHSTDSADPDTHTIAAAVDDWADLKEKMCNRAMEMMESMLDKQYPRPLPFAPVNQAHDGNKYDFDIVNSCAILTCALIVKHRDPENPLGDDLIKSVWNPQEESGVLWEYYTHRRAFSFETTKDAFSGQVENLTLDATSTGRIYLAGMPNQNEILRYPYRVKISTAGVPETAKYQFSSDGGLTYSTTENDTYERFTYLVAGVYIRFEGTFVDDDEWEITFADPRQEINSAIGSVRIDTSGYSPLQER